MCCVSLLLLISSFVIFILIEIYYVLFTYCYAPEKVVSHSSLHLRKQPIAPKLFNVFAEGTDQWVEVPVAKRASSAVCVYPFNGRIRTFVDEQLDGKCEEKQLEESFKSAKCESRVDSESGSKGERNVSEKVEINRDVRCSPRTCENSDDSRKPDESVSTPGFSSLRNSAAANKPTMSLGKRLLKLRLGSACSDETQTPVTTCSTEDMRAFVKTRSFEKVSSKNISRIKTHCPFSCNTKLVSMSKPTTMSLDKALGFQTKVKRTPTVSRLKAEQCQGRKKRKSKHRSVAHRASLQREENASTQQFYLPPSQRDPVTQMNLCRNSDDENNTTEHQWEQKSCSAEKEESTMLVPRVSVSPMSSRVSAPPIDKEDTQTKVVVSPRLYQSRMKESLPAQTQGVCRESEDTKAKSKLLGRSEMSPAFSLRLDLSDKSDSLKGSGDTDSLKFRAVGIAGKNHLGQSLRKNENWTLLPCIEALNRRKAAE